MATSSLGRLTLDLIVKLGSYEQGLDAAERKTKKSADNMKQAFSGFKQQIADAFGGTQIGSVIDGFNSKIGSLKGGVLVAGAAIAGMAVGGVIAGVGALAQMSIEAAKADAELQVLANRANTSVQNFQILEKASAGLGVAQDQLGAILADVQEKLGEFSATQGGGAADFFDALKNNTKMTDDQIKAFGKTLQGKDGVEAIQMLNNKMDDLGVTSQERRFVFESLASDLGNLAPLFAENGQLLNEYGKALEDAGVLKTKESMEQSRLLAAQTQALQIRYEGFKNHLTAQMMPVLNSIISQFMDGSVKSGQFGTVIQSVGVIAKGVGLLIIGLAAAIKTVVIAVSAFAEQAANISITAQNVWNADGVIQKAKALGSGVRDGFGIAQKSVAELGENFASTLDSMSAVMNANAAKATDPLAQALLKTGAAAKTSASGLKIDTKAAEENAKAKEKQAQALVKAAKEQESLNKLVGASALSGLRIKSSEAFAGGQVRGYTANFAQLAQKQLGADLNRFTAFNDLYHKGTNSKHATGNAFDFTIADASKSAQAVAQLESVAKRYGYVVKILDEYKQKSARATGGHLHVSVLGFKGTAEAAKQAQDEVNLIAQTNEEAKRIQEETQHSQKSVIQNYLTEREKLELDHIGKLKAINDAFAGDDSAIKKYTGLQNTAYEKGLSAHTQAQKLKDLSEKKALLEVRQNWMTAGDYAEQYYSLVREEILATSEYSPDMKNALIKQANIQQGIEQNEKRESVWSDYKSMMGLDESPYQQDMNLLKAARDEMLITDEEYQRQRLEMQLSYGAQYGADFAGMMMGLVDSSSSAYTVLGLAQKSFALYSVMMDSKVAISKAWASAAFPYNMPAVGMAVMQTGLLEAAVSALSPVGFAGGGFTGFGGKYEPAGIVHKGEGVLNQEEIAALGGPAGFYALRDSIRNGFADGGLALDAPKLMNVQSPAMQDYVNQTQQNASAQLTPQHLQINNILDPSIVGDFMGTTAGTKTFMNFIKNNRTSLKAVLA